jgi:hypothetical protein
VGSYHGSLAHIYKPRLRKPKPNHMHPLQDFQVPSLEVRPLVILSLAKVRQIGARPYIRTRFVHGLSVFGKFGNAALAAFSKNLKFYFIKI